MRKIAFSRHITTANTPFIYHNLPKYHITNVNHELDIAPMQKFLKINCLHKKKTPFFLEHGYFGAVNMGSDYVGFLLIRQGADISFLHMEA